jgi:Transposase DDE domain
VDEPGLIRSYQRIFRPERRLYQVEGRSLPVPGGVPLRWLGWATGTLLAALVLSSGSATVALLAAAGAGLAGFTLGGWSSAALAATAAERELQAAGVKQRPEVVLADAGYWSNDHIDALRARRMIPLVAPDTTRNRPRRTRLGGPYDFMRRVLATERGDELYSRRLGMVEPVFGQIKANRRIGRFKRRGRAAARSEWRLIAATHNLVKLHRHNLATAAA